jgi:hypothetical protein
MHILRSFAAYAVGVLVTFFTGSAFITWRIIAEQEAVGAQYDATDAIRDFSLNVPGLVSGGFGPVLAIALFVGFLVAAVLKRILTPLSPIAYPLAGAAAVLAALVIIGAVMAPGVGGAIPGARSPLELGLQALAGALGGLAFEFLRPRRTKA